MKMKKIALAVAAVGMVFGVASVSAGELANEFNGLLSIGSLKTDTGATSTTASFGYGGLNYGHFFSPSVEGIVGVQYMTASGGGGTMTTVGGTIGGLYYFSPIGKAGNTAFYAGADVGGSGTSGGGVSYSASRWDVNGGMKYFVTDSAALDVKLMHQEDKLSVGNTKTKNDMVLIGASAFF